MDNRKTVAVIFGGCSPEYDVSLNSSFSIINAIDREKYDVILIGITRQGIWYLYSGDEADIPSNKWHENIGCLKKAAISPSRGGGLLVFDDDRVSTVAVDAIFPVLHGRYGEDGTIQGLCELAGIPVVGSGSAASALCMDKDRAHKVVSLAGICVPGSVCFEYIPSDAEVMDAARKLKLPLFVKPVKGGSSLGVSKIESYSQLPETVKLALQYDDAVIIEEGVDGIEIGCAVIGNTELKTGRVDEIEVSKGFFNYEEKYTLKTSKIHVPARIDEQTEKCVQNAAMTIYRALGCRGYARMDMYLTRENDIVFLEANTIPGFTPHSQLPRMMKAIGIEYPELVDTLINLALKQ